MKTGIIGDARTQAARISNLYEMAQESSVWSRELLKRTLRKIHNGDGIGPYLTGPLAAAVIAKKYVTVDFTKETPVKLTVEGMKYAGIEGCDKPCGPSDYYPGGKCDKEGCYKTHTNDGSGGE